MPPRPAVKTPCLKGKGRKHSHLKFNHEALSGLGDGDRALFESFGQGPILQPRFVLLHEAFAHWAARQADRIAAEHLGREISYGDLDRLSNAVALRLLDLGVQPGDHVALFLRRSIPMLAGILGCLKVGAAYVPQDVKVAPASQLETVMASAGVRVVLTLSEFAEAIPLAESRHLVALDELSASEEALPALSRPIDRHDSCFVLFTSGTTGKPNGLQVTHCNVSNILLTAPGDLGMRPGLKVAQILSIAFDMAAWEILGALCNGATLRIRGEDLTDAAAGADVVIATPSVLGRIDATRCRGVRTVAVAGEPCPHPLAMAWSEFATFYNACGPTETTIVNTAQAFDREDGRLTIGRPTPNNTVYVLDENLRPCPIGEVGEMWAGGLCVSKGYLDNDQLNAERYRPDPFLGGEARMFRTRDLGRWTVDGELEHYGRTDDQVKVRGFRVELDSVSTMLETAPRCMKAVTLKRDERTLVSFVSPACVDTEDARARVAAALPYYCVPEQVIALADLPVTSRGKVDKRLLLSTVAAETAAPGTEVAAE